MVNASPSSSARTVPPSDRGPMEEWVELGFIQGRKIEVGCAGHRRPGWESLDIEPDTGADHILDLTKTYPSMDDQFDTILASHVLEHIDQQDLFTVFDNLWRMLRSGGHLICVTPYGSSDDAWENPHHRQMFTEATYCYFCKALYEVPGNAGYKAHQGRPVHPWQIRMQSFVPYPEYVLLPEGDLYLAKRKYRNVIKELHVVMHKPV